MADAARGTAIMPPDTASHRETEPFNQEKWVQTACIEDRLGFVRKVYGILSVQLILTVVIAFPSQRMTKPWLQSHAAVLWVSLVMTMVTMCAISCCREAARKFPTNYIFLFTFTIFEGVVVGFVSAEYTWQSVVLATAITVFIFLMMTAYACMTTTDFTGAGPYLFAGLMCMLAFGFVLAIMNACGIHIEWLFMVYDFFGVLIFTFYIVFDTQLILGCYGGQRRHQFTIDDYVFAALALYLDIIQLFLHILHIFGNRR